MITLTPQAAEQIRNAAQQSETENLSLRLAARQNPDGSMEYGMGFDETSENDLSFECEGIEVVFDAQYGPLLSGTVIDFVELEPGQYHFIFMNPNDANYSPGSDGGGCGSSGGCGGGCSC